MNSGICGVVVGHGRVAEALVDAAEGISGVTDALVPVSNDGCDRDRLEDRIAEAINGRPSVVFIDLPSGSCLLAALHRFRGQSESWSSCIEPVVRILLEQLTRNARRLLVSCGRYDRAMHVLH